MKQIILSFVLLVAINSMALAQSTQPDQGPSVAPSLAPSYLQIGKDLSLRIELYRDTVGELPLDANVHAQANKLMDDVSKQLSDLITQMQAGQLPPNATVVALPQKIREARQQVLDLIGPDQSKRLQEKFSSVRGQARLQLCRLRLMLDNLALQPVKKDKTVAILDRARTQANALPDTTQPVDDASKSTEAMNHLLADTHDNLAKVLSPEEQTQLGPKFAELAMLTRTTQP